MAPQLSLRSVGKTFAGVQALTDVTLDLHQGEILALLGENGAGKSTLLRILTGDHAPSTGELLLDGQPIAIRDPKHARDLGIRIIAQEPEIIGDVSVAENIYIGALAHRRHRFSALRLRERATADLARYGFDYALNPDTLGRLLAPAQRQLVEIMRALTTNPSVIAFDEPTSSLSDGEVRALFTLIRRLAAAGVAVVYVSHRMSEIFQIANRAAVLRDGRLVGVRKVADTDETEIVRMMVGRDLSAMFRHQRHPGTEVVLSVRGLSNDHVRDITFDVHAGEVVALAGLVGAGRSELTRTIVADLHHSAGAVSIRGRQIALRNPRDTIRAGIALVPEERKAQALLLMRSVRDNTSLAILDRLRRWRFVRRREEHSIVRELVERLRVRTPSLEQEIRKLSGGNQQKVVLARWLARKPQVLILDEPTRGVDVGAKAEIYAIIDELAQAGMAILVVSSELPEVLGLADRILVMQGGRITGELDAAHASEESILALALPHDTKEPVR